MLSEEKKQEILTQYKDAFLKNGYDLSIKDNEFIIKNDDIMMSSVSPNIFTTGKGVFCDKDYDFVSKENYVAIDIGLNIGLASLFLANKSNIKMIYGFEPFKQTFIQAQKNIETNQKYKSKIKIYNYGLGAKNEKLEMNYNADLPGSMSSVADRFKDNGDLEEIEIKNVSDELEKIVSKTTEKIFLKMDCEGSEYKIIDDLCETGMIDKIDLIIMEYHFQYPFELIKQLESTGFVLFVDEVLKNELGMIRAIRI